MGAAQLSQGHFITFEGGEGAGKSTLLRYLAGVLTEAGYTTRATREPGGSPGAEEIRRMLLSGLAERWDAETEALLIFAARRNHIETTVRPALAAGEVVLCDRFADSTLAYQGWGRGLPRDRLRELHRFVVGDLVPDLTLLFDVPVDVGLSRAAARPQVETRFERLDHDFHERVRQGFLEIARQEGRRCTVIDATAPLATVQRRVIAAVSQRLGIALEPAGR